MAAFPRNFTFPARAENVHAIAAIFQPGGRANISARAETRHVIGPFMSLTSFKNIEQVKIGN